ncbi:hypothetical protein T12_9834, partial [Trichinella patagoniensis]
LFLMANVSELHLVQNRCGGMSLVYEGRIYKLKRAGRQKYWRCSKDKKGCGGAVWTNLDVTTVIKRNDHIESCQEDEHLAYKMEKKAVLTKRSAEETKPILAIYDEEASAAFSNKAAVLEVDLNPDTIICDFETALIPAIRGYFPNTRVQGCYFHFCQAVHRKVGELGLKTRYRQHEETRRKIRMLLATAFLPVPHVNTGVSLLEAGTTAAEEMESIPKIYTEKASSSFVYLETAGHFIGHQKEQWQKISFVHFRISRQASNNFLGFYELFRLMIDAGSENVISDDLWIGNSKYIETQQRTTALSVQYAYDGAVLK